MKQLLSGEKPFECNSCNQKFSTKSYLRSHIKSHDEKKKTHKRKISNNRKSTKKEKTNVINVETITNVEDVIEMELQQVDENSTVEYVVEQNIVEVTTFT